MNFEGFCIRGLLSVFLSRGMENLTKEINARYAPHGSSVAISDHGWAPPPMWFCNVPWLTQQCIAMHRRGRKIVLIGHSFGGTSAIMVTQNLNALKIPVALSCPIDPAYQYTTVITPNAQRVVGFYQKTPGQLGQGVDAEGKGWTDQEWHARTVDYRRFETHLQIADDPFTHKTILAEIAKL